MGLCSLVLGLSLASPAAGGESGMKTTGVNGGKVYAGQCARCHGEDGGGLIGPAIIGPDARLGNYRSGSGLLDYVASTMPQDAPGSLDSAQYRAVVVYLLKRNGYDVPAGVDTDSAFSGIDLQAEEGRD